MPTFDPTCKSKPTEFVLIVMTPGAPDARQDPVSDTGPASLKFDDLVDAVYGELRQIARSHRRKESLNLTLQTTALVHEAYLRLASGDTASMPQDSVHLKALTSRVIRHILIDYARRRKAAKRDHSQACDLLEECLIEPSLNVDILDLDAAIHRLSRHSERLGQVVEYRFFGGLNAEETAQLLDVSSRTVERDWRNAKAHLMQYLQPAQSSE
jgi:RNA polymerase sigma factor (TIGR02999 family)